MTILPTTRQDKINKILRICRDCKNQAKFKNYIENLSPVALEQKCKDLMDDEKLRNGNLFEL